MISFWNCAFRPAFTWALTLGWLGLPACTATEQRAETAAPTVPTEVRTDADRQAIYHNGAGSGSNTARPDATPNQMRLGEQASDINRRKRIESLNTNDPNTSTPETRLERLSDAPAATPATNSPSPPPPR
jgi:hypothetical protein